MPTVEKWSKIAGERNIYRRPSKTSPTGMRYRAYWFGPKDENGKRRQLTKVFTHFRGPQGAKAFLEQKTHQKITGGLTDPRAGRRPLRELYEEVHEVRKYAPATVALHGWVWKMLAPLHDQHIADIDRPAIARVLRKIEKPAMRQKARSLLHTLYQHALQDPKSWGVVTNPATAPTQKEDSGRKVGARV